MPSLFRFVLPLAIFPTVLSASRVRARLIVLIKTAFDGWAGYFSIANSLGSAKSSVESTYSRAAISLILDILWCARMHTHDFQLFLGLYFDCHCLLITNRALEAYKIRNIRHDCIDVSDFHKKSPLKMCMHREILAKASVSALLCDGLNYNSTFNSSELHKKQAESELIG